ncbi:MAG: (d)CMP kinase [Clostridia bacterium]|nr:(d)CMP kinase [Clostridia bacterium]
MVLAEIEDNPKHIYLKGAADLRKDITEKLNIAIDGPAGSGKSTVSKIISKRFDILYLDTGAMYRACALACVNLGVDCANESAVNAIVDSIDISVKYENKMQRTYLNGTDVSESIRTPKISMLASVVAAHGCIRTKMVDLQRKIAKENSCVLDGRDIGTNVLPHAEFKFFLTASPEIRANRRLAENELKGFKQSFADVLQEIKARDEQDINRKIAPLLKADDAIEISSDKLSEEEVADAICAQIQGKI